MRKLLSLFLMLVMGVSTMWADGLQQAKAGATAITSITSGNDYIIKCSGQASQVTYMYDNNGTINATTNLPTGTESMKYVWTITLNSDNTTYTVQNKKTGKQITFESTENNGPVTTSDAGTAITIEYNGNICGMKNSSNQYIDMKYSGQGSCTWSGTVASSKAMTILEADIETIPVVSTESSKTFYTFKSKRNNTKYAQYKGDATQMGMTDAYVPSILWYVTSGSTTGTYKLHNYETTKLYAGTSSFTDAGVDVYIAASSYNDGYCVVSTQENLGGNCWDAQGGGTMIGTWGHLSGDNEGTSWLIAEASISDLKATLNTLLTNIKSTYIDNAGTGLGKYSGDTYNALNTQYTTSKGVYDNASATIAEVAAAYDALNNIAKPTVNNLSARGIYKLTSAYTAAAEANVVMADNGSTNACWLKTADVSAEHPYEAYWILNPLEDGSLTFRNLYTGKFIGAVSNGNFAMNATTPAYFVINQVAVGQYSFTVNGTTNRLHCRAIFETFDNYSTPTDIYYKGGSSEAYWIMPVSGNDANSGQAWTLTQISASEADLLAIHDFARTEAQTYLAKVGDNPYDYTSASTATLQGMVTTAQSYLTGVKTSDEIAAEVTTITNGKAAAIAALAKTGFLNTAYYTIKNQPNSAQYLRYDGENNYASAKGTAEDNANRQWAIFTVDGKKYVYNMGAEKFLSFNSSGDKNTYWVLDASTIKAFSITEATGAAAFNIKQEDKGSDTYLHYSGWYTYYTTNWYEGSSSSNQASMWVIEKAGDLTSVQQTALQDKIGSGAALSSLTELVATTKANYYDSWNSSWRLSQTGLNSYWYINEPEEGMKLDKYLTAAESYINGSEEKTASACNTYITNINAIVANLTINTPKAGSFIRVRNASDRRYLQCTESAKTGRAAFGDTGADAIFYYDGTHMLGYNNGLYAVNSSNFWGVGAEGMTVSFVQANDGTIGQYNVVFNNNRALYSQTSTVNEQTVYHTDAGGYSESGKLTNGGYKFWLEEVASLPLTISAAGWATFSAPIKVKAQEGYQVFTVNSSTSYSASLTEQTAAIPANCGVLVKGNEGTCTMTISSDDAFDATDNKLKPVVAAATIGAGTTAYILAKHDKKGVGFYLLNNSDRTISGHKAYLETTSSVAQFLSFSFGEVATGINEAVATEAQDGKFIENGQLVIVKGGVKYNVAGQIVK